MNYNKNKLCTLYSFYKIYFFKNFHYSIKYLIIPNSLQIVILKNKSNNQNNYFILDSKLLVGVLQNGLYTINFRNTNFNFIKKLVYLLNYDIHVYYKQLLLKGSGFKCYFFKNTNHLTFKVGCSHKKQIVLPWKGLRVIIQKYLLIVFDFNNINLGNFTKKIQLIKKFNIFTGRGISLYKNKQKLKLIKK